MAEARSSSYVWFRAFLVVGALLGITLLVQSIRNYHFVSNSLIQEELLQRANREATFLGFHVSGSGARTPEELAPVIQEVVDDSTNVAWIRLISQDGEVFASGGSAQGDPLHVPEQQPDAGRPDFPNAPDQPGPPDLPVQPARQMFEVRGSGAERVLVTISSLRFRGQGGRRG